MKITVCIGTPCHIKGARPIVEELQDLILEHDLEGKVELCGSLCMGKCQDGVCVSVDSEVYSVTPESVASFFEKEVLSKITKK